MTVAGLILAAGAGKRFGGPKALARIDDETFLARSVRTLTEAGCSPVLVVVGAAADEVAAQCNLDEVVFAEAWQQGMSASLRAGLGAATERDIQAVVVALVDQPWITPACVRRLIAAWTSGAAAVVATYDGQPRNPVLLDRSVWSSVSDSLAGDTGAKDWLRENPSLVVGIECADIGNAADVDYPEDLLGRT